ncbi:hypothetical protein EVAR_34514_1 [Eumeta japonica]|uniref:Uncharacterized protein n=1 Tax=Eumeta variegata TaxID=151549 RepID=A0A4C1Z5B5_EUMVA|nr:hypothetical protein EVAR_34514_1 [Eumeta japonica]
MKKWVNRLQYRIPYHDPFIAYSVLTPQLNREARGFAKCCLDGTSTSPNGGMSNSYGGLFTHPPSGRPRTHGGRGNIGIVSRHTPAIRYSVINEMIEKLPQSRYKRGNVKGGTNNLETKDGLAALLPCLRPYLGNCPCLPIHITIKVEIKGRPTLTP